MILKVPPIFRKRPAKVHPTRQQATPLELIAAEYFTGEYIDLTFDRAIDIGGLVGGAMVVEDGDVAMSRFVPLGAATLVSPNKVRLELVYDDAWDTPGQTFSASAENGIVAADDGGAWPGITDLGLPFP